MDRVRKYHFRRSSLRRGRYLAISACVLLVNIGPGTTGVSALESVTTINEVLARVSQTATAEVAAAATDIAVAELSQSESERFPVVTVDAQDNLAGDSSSYEPDYVLRVEQMLLDWGRVDEDVSARASTIEAKRSGETEAVLDAALQSAEAFYGIDVVNRKLRSNAENRRSLEDLRGMMERRVTNRVSPNIDLQEVSNRINLLDIADRRLEADKRRLQLVLIRLAGVLVEETEASECVRSAPLDEGLLVKKALAFSPTLDRLRHQADRYAYDEKALDASQYPSLIAGYRADSKLDGNEFDQRAYLALRYEFRVGGDLESRRAGERARYLEQKALYRKDAERITQTIGAWVSSYRVSVSLAEVYRRVISSKVEQKDSHLRRFLAGRSSWRDVLGAQQEAAESRTAQIDSQGAICLASSSLALLAGGMSALR